MFHFSTYKALLSVAFLFTLQLFRDMSSPLLQYVQSILIT
jgi:hypothetical protein